MQNGQAGGLRPVRGQALKKGNQNKFSMNKKTNFKKYLKQPASGQKTEDKAISAGVEVVSSLLGFFGARVAGKHGGLMGAALYVAGHAIDNRAVSAAGLGMAFGAAGAGATTAGAGATTAGAGANTAGAGANTEGFAASLEEAKERVLAAAADLKKAFSPAKKTNGAGGEVAGLHGWQETAWDGDHWQETWDAPAGNAAPALSLGM
jgi:hypothetical protein